MTKTELIREKLRKVAYDNPLPYPLSHIGKRNIKMREDWGIKEGSLKMEFMADLEAYLIEDGVPAKYARKVAYRAWDDGHSSGFYEVFNVASNLAEIFRVS